MSTKLQIGDVFAIIPGHKIQVSIAKKYVYSNEAGNNEITQATVTVGTPQRREVHKMSFDTNIFVGHYVVFSAGPTDRTDWQIRAKKLDAAGAWDPNEEEILFDQGGHYNYTNNDPIPVIKKMKMMFV